MPFDSRYFRFFSVLLRLVYNSFASRLLGSISFKLALPPFPEFSGQKMLGFRIRSGRGDDCMPTTSPWTADYGIIPHRAHCAFEAQHVLLNTVEKFELGASFILRPRSPSAFLSRISRQDRELFTVFLFSAICFPPASN